MFGFGNMLSTADATQVLVATATFSVIVILAVPVLLRLILPPSLHNDSIARAATVAVLLVTVTVITTTTIRSSATKAAGRSNTISVEQVQKTVDLHTLPAVLAPEP